VKALTSMSTIMSTVNEEKLKEFKMVKKLELLE
jgi:hypothetical protein